MSNKQQTLQLVEKAVRTRLNVLKQYEQYDINDYNKGMESAYNAILMDLEVIGLKKERINE